MFNTCSIIYSCCGFLIDCHVLHCIIMYQFMLKCVHLVAMLYVYICVM